METHLWGDDWEHWDDLYKAETFIQNFVKGTSPYLLSSKEKYGTLRYEHTIPQDDGEWDTEESWRNVYYAVKAAVKLWPHLEEELMEDLSYREELVGPEIHAKYWRKV